MLNRKALDNETSPSRNIAVRSEQVPPWATIAVFSFRFLTFDPRGPWFQYHWDRFTFPPGSTQIARNELCPQAYVYGRTLGVQFHPEIDADILDLWLAMEGGRAEAESEGVVVEDLRTQTKNLEKQSNQRGYDLVDQFLDRIATAPILLI